MIGTKLTHQGNRAEIVRILGTWAGWTGPNAHSNGLIVNLYVFATETIERAVRVISTPSGMRVVEAVKGMAA